MTKADTPLTCDLSLTDGAARALEWRTLQDLAIDRERSGGGAVLTFPSSLRAQVADLAAREAACCWFLAISIEDQRNTIRLNISSHREDARRVIELLAGLER